jgi:hypothetical protein
LIAADEYSIGFANNIVINSAEQIVQTVYYRVPRNGTLQNLYASVALGAEGFGGRIFTITLMRSPNPFTGFVSTGISVTLNNQAAGLTFVTGDDTVNTFDVVAGDFIALFITINLDTATAITISAGVELV